VPADSPALLRRSRIGSLWRSRDGFLGGGWLLGLGRRGGFGSHPGPTSAAGLGNGLLASGAEISLRRKKEKRHNLSDATSSVPIAATVRRIAIP